MSYPITIKLFLVKGQPDGLRTAEILNWSGWAVACPRSDLTALKTRSELARPGVYILIGPDTDTGDTKIYVGEADDVLKRVTSVDHGSREFWTKVICFVSKDSNLSKGHIKYLEGRLIGHANDLGIMIENSKASGSSLSESDIADMEHYLDKLRQLLPVLGLNIFEIPEQIANDSEQWLYCMIKGLTAKGRRTSNGFLVASGSQAVKEHRPSAKYWKLMREELIAKEILINSGDHLIFTRDYEFSSPSAAGAAIRGGSTNGLTAWQNKQGISLKELEIQEAS